MSESENLIVDASAEEAARAAQEAELAEQAKQEQRERNMGPLFRIIDKRLKPIARIVAAYTANDDLKDEFEVTMARPPYMPSIVQRSPLMCGLLYPTRERDNEVLPAISSLWELHSVFIAYSGLRHSVLLSGPDKELFTRQCDELKAFWRSSEMAVADTLERLWPNASIPLSKQLEAQLMFVLENSVLTRIQSYERFIYECLLREKGVLLESCLTPRECYSFTRLKEPYAGSYFASVRYFFQTLMAPRNDMPPFPDEFFIGPQGPTPEQVAAGVFWRDSFTPELVHLYCQNFAPPGEVGEEEEEYNN